MNKITKPIHKKRSKKVNRHNFCYCKVGSAITSWGAIEKSAILGGPLLFSPAVLL